MTTIEMVVIFLLLQLVKDAIVSVRAVKAEWVIAHHAFKINCIPKYTEVVLIFVQ